MDNATIAKTDTVRAALLESPDGGFTWGVLHTNANGADVIVGNDLANCDEAKSAAWAFAQAHGAVFVSTKSGVRT